MELPRVLLDPPWRARTAPLPAATSAAPAHATHPASLTWVDGERERYAGKPPPKMTPVAEERLLERLLDAAIS